MSATCAVVQKERQLYSLRQKVSYCGLNPNFLFFSASCEVALSSISVARSLRIWLSQLIQDIKDGVPRDAVM